ncbi:hypothetical protein LTR53_000933 [Teratosphaeriaceae sp. CCFEE 6253]|nr:hypothetical protein LTR53_000933 [Teratosphaeriaceae sp. CCFEE 6253]
MSMLDLPRELYLMVCSYLQPTDLASLAGITRDHYLAVQEPLYTTIRIAVYSHLVRLVETLGRIPVVSTTSPQQRLRWWKLTDAQLRERDVKHLHLTIDSRTVNTRITGAALANLIGAIARKCQRVEISLTLHGAWPNFITQLEKFGLPSVTTLALFLGTPGVLDPKGPYHSGATPLWDLVFCGSAFPDLRRVYINTMVDHPEQAPTTLHDSVHHAIDFHASQAIATTTQGTPLSTAVPFNGLRRMEEITLTSTSQLTVAVIESLFSSAILPHHLTKLEIVDCPALHPAKHLPALATLLQRALQLVAHLKLHLCSFASHGRAVLDGEYGARIAEHPDQHLCHIVRELGSRILYLDLALAFACAMIFPPLAKSVPAFDEARGYPVIPREPLETLPQRLVGAGYKYRRLISWHGICGHAHQWHEMRDAAAMMREGAVSWELLCPGHVGSWHVEGCLAVKFDTSKDVMRRPFLSEGP